MRRRSFLSTSLAAGLGAAVTSPQNGSAAEDAPAPQGVLAGPPVVSGPAPETLTILQPVHGPATGHLELAIGEADFQRVDAEAFGLLPLERYTLKFRLPPLPPGQTIRYRVTARPITFHNAYKIEPGESETTAERSFRTLDPTASETRFVVWNDTHENLETIRTLQQQTDRAEPDFLLWNGDQTNDIYDPAKMTNQYLAPAGLEISACWPLAYVRGNHDVRGPAARHLPEFTGTPDDRFYYAFRSGPMAALVMDTGEDKPDDHPVFAGLAGFSALRQRQRRWLAETIRQPWFQTATYRVLFCHIPLWWTDEVSDPGYWLYAKPCREAWLPLLEEAGIQLVISGHTHRATWMPASKTQPIPQLIGGGPRPEIATIMEGTATAQQLTLVTKTLEGKVVHEVTIPA